MTRGKTGSGSSSAETSTSKPSTPDVESDFLLRQAADAKAAMKQTLSDIGRNLGRTLDLRLWTRQYPKLSVTAAAAAGFAAAAAVVPSSDETMKERWEALVAHLKTEATALRPEPPPREEKASWASSLIKHVAEVVKQAAVAGVSSAVTARAQQSAGGDGHGRG